MCCCCPNNFAYTLMWYLGSGCGKVDSEIASHNREQGLNPVIGNFYWTTIKCQLFDEKTKIKKTEAGIGPCFKNRMSFQLNINIHLASDTSIDLFVRQKKTSKLMHLGHDGLIDHCESLSKWLVAHWLCFNATWSYHSSFATLLDVPTR